MSLNKSGHIMTWVLGFMATVSVIVISAASVIDLVLSDAVRTNKNQLSLNIADAGINYYLWHMSHSGADFQDGNTGGTPISGGDFNGFYGPYEHEYKDDNGDVAGKYILYIKPKSAGSTIAIVRSVGQSLDGKYSRVLEAEIGAPSFASYVIAINGSINFGETSTAGGPVHSNVGVRMDAPNLGDVTSANATYNYSGQTKNGVWCQVGTANCNAQRNSSNGNGTWRYPVPALDFNSITGELCNIKKKAFESDPSTIALASDPNACNIVTPATTSSYIRRLQTTYNSERGYLIELNSNGTYDLFSVNGENYTSTTYSYTAALSETLITSNIPIPSNGVIFVEDNVWVRTEDAGFPGRVTIAAARLASASENANIIIADDVKYSTKDGKDAIGLVAEQNLWLAPYAPPRNNTTAGFPFELNAAIIAKNGSLGVQDTYDSVDFPYWSNTNQNLIFYGSAAINTTAVWERNGNDGFRYRENTYDYNLLYAPPPSFPITSTYDILKWREILVTP
jgi:hypothetical protein